MFLPQLFLVLVFITLDGVELSRPQQCEMDNGCRIQAGRCYCDYGCKSDYPYSSYRDCQKALKGRRSDICSRTQPCRNSGSCIQISLDPGYKCRCDGTGYYGTHCERACPTSADPYTGIFPYECIVI
ncbi:delta-like protein 4 [Ctenocephalides felis]|uniref:delta-like protein 4 n=1 Tax=Ctenocephalides felis TaxID=7515 RepID=UPI000E6E137C|nr:delta-like protein 4 [Ctenocephalides felis]